MNRTLIRGGRGLGAAFCSHAICQGDVDSRCCVLPRPQFTLMALLASPEPGQPSAEVSTLDSAGVLALLATVTGFVGKRGRSRLVDVKMADR